MLIDKIMAERFRRGFGGKYDRYVDDLALAFATVRGAALDAAAKQCDDQIKVFSSEEYAVGQPLSSFQERFACGRCKEAILALKDEPDA